LVLFCVASWFQFFMSELLLKEEVYAIIGAVYEVYYTLGIGFLEPVYQEALSLFYKDTELSKLYIADLVCYGQIIVELKVVPRLTNIEVAQLINYLKITKKHLGLLVNFGSAPKPEWKRYVI
jgi:hypothetical protein